MTERYTRRDFLGQLASAAAAVAAGGGITPVAARGRPAKRVILVGAGITGLCAAYELSALGHDVTVLEAQPQPGGRVYTLRAPFADGLYAEAGASRIPTSHDLTLGYARQFGLPLIPFAPTGIPSIRYVYGQRTKVMPGTVFEWPAGIAAEQKRMTPPEVRRRYIEALADQITEPFSTEWLPASLRQYDGITRDAYLRAQGVSEAALHMMNLGSTPVARFRSFLDVLHEVAVNRELRRRAGTDEDQLLKIDGGNDRLPHAFAARLSGRIRYQCPVRRIEHDSHGARVFFTRGGSLESCAGRLCSVRHSVLNAPRRRVFTPSHTRKASGDRRAAVPQRDAHLPPVSHPLLEERRTQRLRGHGSSDGGMG